jgi:hypothetical protein
MIDRARLPELLESLLDDDLDADDAEALAALLAADPESAARFLDDARWSLALRASLRGPEPDLAGRVERLIAGDRASARVRIADSVARRIGRLRRWRWALPTALAAMALVAALIVLGRDHGAAHPVIATISRIDGGADLRRAGASVPATAGMEVVAGDTLTIAGGGAALSYRGEDTTVELAAATSLRLDEDRGGKLLELLAGGLSAEVPPQPPGRPMRLLTAIAEVRVIGTRFTLTTTDGATRLDVSDGRVRLTRRSDQVAAEVSAGQYAIAEDHGDLVARPSTPGERSGSVADGFSRAVLDSMVGYWSFEDESTVAARDWSGHGHDAALQGAARRAPGKRGQALSLQGADDRMTIPGLSGDRFPSSGTLALWVRIERFPPRGSWGDIVDQDGGIRNHLFIVTDRETGNGVAAKFCRMVADDAVVDQAKWTAPLPSQQWCHLAVVWDEAGRRGTLYVDGRAISSQAIPGAAWRPDGQVLRFGGRQMSQLIDEIVLCDQPLAADEVLALSRR